MRSKTRYNFQVAALVLAITAMFFLAQANVRGADAQAVSYSTKMAAPTDYVTQEDMAAYAAQHPAPAGPAGPPGPAGASVTGPAGPAGADGSNPTPQQVQSAVSSYMAANPPPAGPPGPAGASVTGPAGPAGINGSAGRAPTSGEIALAVSTYLVANPPAKGDTGAQGIAGTPGTAGATGPAGPTSLVVLGTYNVSQTAVAALSAGIRSVDLNVPGVVLGENVDSFHTTAPLAGYNVVGTAAVATNTVRVFFSAPLLALGANFTFPVRVVAYR